MSASELSERTGTQGERARGKTLELAGCRRDKEEQ